MKLNFHLEDQHAITLRDSQNLPALLNREDIKITMFTEWFELNMRDPAASELTYTKILKPLKLWEQTWELLLEDILRKKRKLYKPDGIRKTFLYKTIISRLRSKCMIVLTVASSGIASLLLPGDWTAHSRCGRRDCRSQKKEDEDEATWIEILEDFIIKVAESPNEQIVKETFPDFTTRKRECAYLKERVILTPRNDDADAINAYLFEKLPGPTMTYNNADEVSKASTDVLDQKHLYPTEFLNTLNFPGIPPHALNLKKELQIMLLQNVNPS
nr:ATP-dependent DNA helicase PIF1-like [Tanacetum cinerariifolium]